MAFVANYIVCHCVATYMDGMTGNSHLTFRKGIRQGIIILSLNTGKVNSECEITALRYFCIHGARVYIQNCALHSVWNVSEKK